MTGSGLKILVSPVRLRPWALADQWKNTGERDESASSVASTESTGSTASGTRTVHERWFASRSP